MPEHSSRSNSVVRHLSTMENGAVCTNPSSRSSDLAPSAPVITCAFTPSAPPPPPPPPSALAPASALVHYSTNYCNEGRLSNKEQLALIKSSLLNPNEVTFCDLSDDGTTSSSYGTSAATSVGCTKSPAAGQRRRRLTSTDTADTDSIVSSVHPKIKPVIPDGGYGWMVVFASLCVSLIADGVSFSFGLLYTELLAYFKESKSKTAWVGSLFMAVPLLSGPIMSNLVDNYGCRKMTILGGFLAGLGFILASMSTSVEMLFITFGVISGLGLGLGYVTAVVSIAFWFDKKRTFATGIGASGTGIGTFLYAPFTQWLIETYGWRGTTLILAGTILNICVCGCLMRDPEWLIEENRLESRSQSIQTFSNSSVCLDEIKKMLEIGAPKEAVLDTLVTNFNTEANQQIPLPEEIVVPKKYQSEMLLPTYLESQVDFTSDGNRHGSWRSLRKRDQQNLSPDEFLTPSTQDTPKTEHLPPIRAAAHLLASIETLSPSEKVSSAEELVDGRNAVAASSGSSDEGYLTCKRNRLRIWNDKMNGSRLSLDDTLMTRPVSESDNNNGSNGATTKNVRGNSVDILYEDDSFKPADQSALLPHANFVGYGANATSIAVPLAAGAGGAKVAKKRHHHTTLNGNLKRNVSLRNSNFFKNMRVHRNSIHYRGAILNTHRYRLRASSCPNIYRNSMTTIAREEEDGWFCSMIDIIKTVFDFSLFKDPKFFLFNLSTFFLFVWFIIPYFYITDHLLKYGFTEEDSANLISVIGISNTVGMVFLGWAGDQPWLNVLKTYAMCLVVCGLSVAMIPLFAHSYPSLIALAVLFGITFASSFSFTPIILVRLVDLDDFTCAYGLVLLVQGIGSLIGPPLAGIIYDLTSRWDDSFFAAGFFIAVSGALAYATGMIEDEDDDNETTSTS